MKHYQQHIKTPIKLLAFKTITLNEIHSIISKLKNSNSCSKDSISGRMLKLIKNSISPLLLVLVNQSIKFKIFPDCTKISKVLPIWKNFSDFTNMVNLRPINILSIFSKITEKVLTKQYPII